MKMTAKSALFAAMLVASLAFAMLAGRDGTASAMLTTTPVPS